MPSIVKTLAPLPQTERGHGIHVYGTTAGGVPRILYTNGNHVIIRQLDDPSQCSIFSEHKVKANVAKFSPNGEWVASGDDMGKVMVWGAKNHNVKNELFTCRKVLDIDWSGDGKRIVAAGDGNDQIAKVFPWDSSSNLGQVSGHSKAILGVAFRQERPFRIVTASEDRAMNFYQGPPFKFATSYKGHARWPNDVAFIPGGEFYVSIGADAQINVFNGKTGEHVRQLVDEENGHKSQIYAFAISPDGSELLTASADKTAKIYDFATGQVTMTFTFGDDVSDQQVGAAWVGDYLLTVSLSGRINILDRNAPDTPQCVIDGHQASPTSLSVSSDGATIVSADSAGRVVAWDATTGASATLTDGAAAGVCTVAARVAADNDTVVSVAFDNVVRRGSAAGHVFDGASSDLSDLGGQPTALTVGHSDADLTVVASTSNKVVLLRGGDRCVVELPAKPTCVALSYDDAQLAVGAADSKVYLFAVDGASLTQTDVLEPPHGEQLTAVAYSPNGGVLTTCCKARRIYMWQLDDLSKPKNSGWRYHNSTVSSVAWTTDSARAISVSADQDLIVWKQAGILKSKRAKLDRVHLGGCVDVVTVAENTIATTGLDKTIKLIDISDAVMA